MQRLTPNTYHVAQEIEKDKIYQNAQIEVPEQVEVSNSAALHHQLFQGH